MELLWGWKLPSLGLELALFYPKGCFGSTKSHQGGWEEGDTPEPDARQQLGEKRDDK